MDYGYSDNYGLMLTNIELKGCKTQQWSDLTQTKRNV